MTVGTTRLHQQNVELFAKLNDELKSLQEQVGTGKAELKLSENLYDISKLSAAEEKKSETQGFWKIPSGSLEIWNMLIKRWIKHKI